MTPPHRFPIHASSFTAASLALYLVSVSGCTLGSPPNAELLTVEDAYAQIESDSETTADWDPLASSSVTERDEIVACTRGARPVVVVNVFQPLSGQPESAVVLYRVWLRDGWSEVRSIGCDGDECSAALFRHDESELPPLGALTCGDFAIARTEDEAARSARARSQGVAS